MCVCVSGGWVGGPGAEGGSFCFILGLFHPESVSLRVCFTLTLFHSDSVSF